MDSEYNVLSLKEAARFCSFSVSTLKRLEKIGDFPDPIKLSTRRIAYKKNEIEKWIDNRSKRRGGDLNLKPKKVRCPSTPLELQKAYLLDMAELKTRKDRLIEKK
tara:strand:- start:787 stop:1101 length:315 start_codon:yes stop_codon:yes gene_type:complete